MSELETQGPRFETPTDPVRGYFRDLRDLHLRPAEFFRRTPTSGGMSGPLAFALVTHWVGSALGFLWAALAGNSLEAQVERYLRMMQQYSEMDAADAEMLMSGAKSSTVEWLFGAGSVIADPFFTLAHILVLAAFVYLGARILVPREAGEVPPAVSYESAVRLVSYGLAPSILYAVPFVGSIVAPFYILGVTAIGAREFYRVTTGRGIIIAIFPKLLLYGSIFAFVLLVFVVIFGLFSAALFS